MSSKRCNDGARKGLFSAGAPAPRSISGQVGRVRAGFDELVCDERSDQRTHRRLGICARTIVSILDHRDDVGDRPAGLQPPPDLGRRRIEAVVVPVGEVDDDRFSVDDLADDACFIDRVALGVTHEVAVYTGAPAHE